MTAIAGANNPDQIQKVQEMLNRMSHRGPAGSKVITSGSGTLGVAWTHSQEASTQQTLEQNRVIDSAGRGHGASATIDHGSLVLERDRWGVAPLYYVDADNGIRYFASEVKALVPISSQIVEMPPGCQLRDNLIQPVTVPASSSPMDDEPTETARKLRSLLENAVEVRLGGGVVGAWLSGGLDSSIISALVRPHIPELHTFAAGLQGSSDLDYAAQMASHLKTKHHVVSVSMDDLIAVLPSVIFHLESFDALLVRSSIMHFLAAQRAADFVEQVFSGEGGDELFAGYDYLKKIRVVDLPFELLDITARLHNTALQRVDRCAGAFGLTAHIPFLDPGVVRYAVQIPAGYKIHDGVVKWILRQAALDLLPEKVLNRPKAKFWEGSGVGVQLESYAEQKISDRDFSQERHLTNGWQLNSKEELMYYRIFSGHFGELDSLDWMGRTKGVASQ